MSSVTVALVGAKEIAVGLGKRGTQSDVTLYNAVRDGHQATLVEPTQYPEKFPPLLSALAMADRVVFVVPGLSKEVAEVAATLDVVAPPTVVRYGENTGEGELKRLFKGSPLEEASYAPLQLAALREEIDSWTSPIREGSVRVRLDHAFPVKGVGAVALGLVRQGTVRAHDSLRLYPTERVVEVRSLQVHDVDVREAVSGSRVGLALRGVEAEELSRGQVLAPPGALTVGTTVEVTHLRLSRYYRGKAATGQTVQAQIGLQIVPAKWASLEGERGRLEFDRPVASEAGESVVVADLSVPTGPRIEGAGRIG